MLEPYEEKFSRTVLRGERGRKALDQLDAPTQGQAKDKTNILKKKLKKDR
jgi:hypothetical protein